jgi:hypothetical protein
MRMKMKMKMKMKVISKLGLGGALAIAALVGCGGNSSGGGFTTSVPSGTKLTSLTPQQAMQLCTDFDAYATNMTPELCKLLAIDTTALSLSFSSTAQPSDATLRATCTQAYNSCLTGGDGGFTTTSSCDPSTFTTEPSTCTATVGDLTMCVNADLTATKQEAAELPSCSSVTATNLLSALATIAAQADGGTSMSATCTALESNCNMGSSSSSTVGLVTAGRRLRK